MEIIVAEYSGFCFGVKQAIEKAEMAAENIENTDKKTNIWSYGPLIHNRKVTDNLARKGIKIAENIQEMKSGDKVIIRSHGTGERFYIEAKEKNLLVVDATCPYVTRIHDLAKKSEENSVQVIIVGDKEHPEVKGINGWCNNTAIIIKSLEEINENITKLKSLNTALVLAQTTIRQETFISIIDSLKSIIKDLKVENTICSATRKRQQGCADLAKKVDLMLVVGDKKSSNTRKLFEISKKYCKNSLFIENTLDLPLKNINKYNRIGIVAGASTPEYAIKEVITRMSENSTNNEVMEQFLDEIDKTLRMPRNGELVSGKVLHVTDSEVIVNLGRKKDGVIPSSEVKLEDGQKLSDVFKEGDEVEAKVLRTDDGDGTILLSRRKLEVTVHWSELIDACENGNTVVVEVARAVRGGVIAYYKEVQGFIPVSQLSDKYVDDPSIFVGETLEVKVTKVEQKKSRAVFSHKARIMEEKQKMLEEIWSALNVGDIVQGKVMRFTDYGAFVDIGGIDGLLHISEISWSKLKHPKEMLELGQEINVKILSMNKEKGKISLGLKQTTPEPWSVIDETFTEGDIVTGKVVQIKEYGCFVEIAPGIDGLVHISEISYQRVNNIHEVLTIGQTVETKILQIDKENKRVSLSIKEVMGDAFAPKKKEEQPIDENEGTEPVEAAESQVEEAPEVQESEVEAAEAAEAPSDVVSESEEQASDEGETEKEEAEETKEDEEPSEETKEEEAE